MFSPFSLFFRSLLERDQVTLTSDQNENITGLDHEVGAREKDKFRWYQFLDSYHKDAETFSHIKLLQRVTEESVRWSDIHNLEVFRQGDEIQEVWFRI